MPRAVVTTETVRKELKTCPEGFVELKPMTYGQMVHRRSMLKLSFTSSKNSKDFTGEMAAANKEITMLEFATCIVDHNLEDENGTKLNLASPVDFARLDPRVGQEIEKLISELNNFDEDDQEN